MVRLSWKFPLKSILMPYSPNLFTVHSSEGTLSLGFVIVEWALQHFTVGEQKRALTFFFILPELT